MMKWKVVKNPRCASADRNLECLKNSASYRSDSNNNEQDPSPKEFGKQQDHLFTRKPSLVKSDCINLKSFLGLTRQRSEINLSDLGLLSGEQRRSRSEVRGVSCDRLSVGYHHSPNIGPPPPFLTNSKTRSSSPVNKSGCWLRGRKKEREVRSSPKKNVEIAGKTVVTESTRSQSKSLDFRTVTDQISRASAKSDRKPSKDSSKGKLGKKGNNERVYEEDIYSEIGQGSSAAKLLNIKQDNSKGPNKKSRKKGQAPQIPTVAIKELNVDVNLNPNGTDISGPNCFDEKIKASPCIKPPRKSVNGKNSTVKNDNKVIQIDKFDNVKNSKLSLSVKEEAANKVVAVAEIHNSVTNSNSDEERKLKKHTSHEHMNDEKLSLKKILDVKVEEENDYRKITIKKNCSPPPKENNIVDHNLTIDSECNDEKERAQEEKIEIPAYHIDTPDYSTLESEIDNNDQSQSTNNAISAYCCVESKNINGTDTNYTALSELNSIDKTTKEKEGLESMVPSILRGSCFDLRGSDTEYSTKKVVRFEKIDLIEHYKKNKTDCSKSTDEESDTSSVSSKLSPKKILDFNSNEVTSESDYSTKQSLKYSDSENAERVTSSSECPSECSLSSPTQKDCPHNGMTVNVVVRNPTPEMTNCIVDSQTDDTHAQLVVKKSFVLTIAKQEKGFKSLCANKKPDAVIAEPPKNDHKISVTFLCANNSPSDNCNKGNPINPIVNSLRLRSISVPPQPQPVIEPPALPPPMRGRSRERRSKERVHCKKNHKSRKKEAAFHMPQAVIDELSQVLEKRKPSPKGIPAR